MAFDSPQYDLEALQVRAEQIIWLPGALMDIEALPEVFEEEFCVNLPEEADKLIYAQLPELARFAEGDDEPDALEVAEVLSGKVGFLIQAAIPVKKYWSDTACQYSWGYYQTEWLYASSDADIAPTMLSWAKAQDDEFKAEYRAGLAAAEAEAGR